MLCPLASLTIAGLVAVSSLSLAQDPANGRAQDYPSRVIQIIVPSAAGTPPDVRARELAGKVALALGKPIVIINKPGAGGGIGLQAAARSPADGHTLVFCTDAPLTINSSVYESLPYDPVKDFTPIMVAHGLQLVLVAHASVPVSSLDDLIRFARAQPGKLFYGSAGNGTPPHILADLFKFTAGLDMVHVPYKGGPAATMALLGGEVVFTIDAPSQVLAHIKTGKLKPLAVTGNKRLAVLPDVPTFAEAGVPGMNASWTAFLAPAGTPQDIVQRLNREFARALHSADLLAFYKTIGVDVVASSPEELARRIREETPKWRELVKRAGVTPG
jgi:tripartite-type tricarboxylate transporter receptor subunit TctC